MSCPSRLSQWQQEVSTAFAHLSKAQAVGLALWSAGIALTGSGGISHISALLALVLQQRETTVLQRLREWYLEPAQKRGEHRRELEVTRCFAPLLRWIIGLMAGSQRRVALALDASTLGERWTVLAISVVVNGCAIPVGRISHWQSCERVLASLLGGVVGAFARQCSSRLARAGARGSWSLCQLAL